MIDKILAISGKPGLFRLVSRGNNMLICESLVDGRRFPALKSDKVLSLSDISMYATDSDVPLNTIFARAKALTEGKVAPVTHKSDPEEQRAWFAQVFPEYDADRVHTGDIRKFIQWFNCLMETGHDDFSEPEAAEKSADAAADAPVAAPAPEATPAAPKKAVQKKTPAASTAAATSQKKVAAPRRSGQNRGK